MILRGTVFVCVSVSQCGKWKHSIRRNRDPPRFPLTSARKEQTIKGTHTLLMCPQEHSVNRAPGQRSQCLQHPVDVTSFVLTLSLVAFHIVVFLTFCGEGPAMRESTKTLVFLSFSNLCLFYIDQFIRCIQHWSSRTLFQFLTMHRFEQNTTFITKTKLYESINYISNI